MLNVHLSWKVGPVEWKSHAKDYTSSTQDMSLYILVTNQRAVGRTSGEYLQYIHEPQTTKICCSSSEVHSMLTGSFNAMNLITNAGFTPLLNHR